MERVRDVFLVALVLLAGALNIFFSTVLASEGYWGAAILALFPWLTLAGYYWAYVRARRRTRIEVVPSVTIKKELSPSEIERLKLAWIDAISGARRRGKGVECVTC